MSQPNSVETFSEDLLVHGAPPTPHRSNNNIIMQFKCSPNYTAQNQYQADNILSSVKATV